MAATLTREGFNALLLADDPAAAVRDALADGWLDALIPEIRREMDVPQRTRYHHLSVLERLGYDRALVDRVVRWIARHMDLHMAARDGHSPKARAKLLGRVGDDLEVLQRLQLADVASMAPGVAEEKEREAREYHSLLAETSRSHVQPIG